MNAGVFRKILQNELLYRKTKYPHYSLRAFAESLQIAPGRLSEYLSGKREASTSTFLRVLARLGLSPEQSLHLLQSAGVFTDAQSALNEADSVTTARSEDQFKFLAEWEHSAILALVDTADFDPRPTQIARRLGVDAVKIRVALERLQRMGLLTKSSRGVWRASQYAFKAPENITQNALRVAQASQLQRAQAALDTLSIELREVSSLTLAVNVAQISKSKEIIRKFRRDMAALLEAGRRSEVYTLSLQLLPVTRLRGRGKRR